MYESVREVIGLIVNDVLETTRRNLDAIKPQSAEDIRHAGQATVKFSEEMAVHIGVLRQFLHTRMYRHTSVNQVCAKARQIVLDLFNFYIKQPNCLPPSWSEVVKACENEAAKARTIADYIAGMTDRFAVQEHRKVFSTETMI